MCFNILRNAIKIRVCSTEFICSRTRKNNLVLTATSAGKAAQHNWSTVCKPSPEIWFTWAHLQPSALQRDFLSHGQSPTKSKGLRLYMPCRTETYVSSFFRQVGTVFCILYHRLIYLHQDKAEFPKVLFLKSQGHGTAKCNLNKDERKGVAELQCGALFWHCTFLGMAARFLRFCFLLLAVGWKREGWGWLSLSHLCFSQTMRWKLFHAVTTLLTMRCLESCLPCSFLALLLVRRESRQ